MNEATMTAEEMFSVIASLSILGGTFICIAAILIFTFVFYTVLYVATRIPYHKMAQRAGIENAWLIWVPIADMYVLLKLSKREFNLFNWIKTRDRVKVFWYWILLVGVLAAVLFMLYCTFFIIYVNIITMILYYIISFVGMIVISVFSWRVYYDILVTYGMGKDAMWLAIINCACPFVMIFCSYMIMNKVPDYSA